MTRALVIDDEPAICQSFESLLHDLDCEVGVAASAEDGLLDLKQHGADLIVLDVRLPGMDGLTALSEIRGVTKAPVIVMTAHGNLSTAVAAVQQGAFDYLPKPFDLEQVTNVLRRAIAEATAAVSDSTDTGLGSQGVPELIGKSLAMQHLFRQIAMAAQHDAPVLITGESGAGKELVAQAIHRHSARGALPLVAVNLASLSEALVERELFGHTAGAFTGAAADQQGMIAQADGGTLFLDEIGETPKHIQVKLLRTLESGEFYPVGASAAQSSGFRLIAATNVPLDALRSGDQFRQDFFYRLATIQIRVPPLREHLSDIPELVQHFLRQHEQDNQREFTPEAVAWLQQRSWPGNIRELRNIVIRAAAASADRAVGVDTLMSCINPEPNNGADVEISDPHSALRRAARHWATQAVNDKMPDSLQSATAIVEAELIHAALSQTNGNRSAAAQLLGIHRETLRDKLQRMNDQQENLD